MTFRSLLPEIEVPSTSLPAFVLEHAAAFGAKPALIDGPTGRTITYAQLNGMSRALAAGLASRGFGPGDLFAIFSPNVPEYALAFHGVLTAGGREHHDQLARAEEIEKQLRATRARFLVTIFERVGKTIRISVSGVFIVVGLLLVTGVLTVG